MSEHLPATVAAAGYLPAVPGPPDRAKSPYWAPRFRRAIVRFSCHRDSIDGGWAVGRPPVKAAINASLAAFTEHVSESSSGTGRFLASRPEDSTSRASL
ncbi:MAG: hypothetical protein HOV96_17895 [Nonomuraea sp.]|nr:hypothetical protein [Nonomuraea sp.]NUP79414.1 hypothetical protein [Nonomuraea sp.]